MIAALSALWGMRSYAPWVVAALCLLGALWYRGQYEACKASIAGEAAKAEAAVNAYKAADAEHTQALAAHTRTITDAIAEQATQTQVALARVQSVASCAKTPAAQAFDAGVRPAGKK